ncbi:division plane positioning ATPase MipZ [Ramlibacter sp.]|uniref:ParA family protein n=1 Tax=Ramlibacter sp. TaxID=1917967 RepID=UPI003D12E6B4
MPVIAVVNRKGGSGKSTFAAHVAAWCARQGHAVMLGDVDRQQSSRGWLRRRPPELPSIAPWALDQKNMLRVPTGISHVVLDTPGGLHGFELARIVMFADAIVMPVCASVFDRESAAACHAELMTLPRVSNGRCRLATVGMRVDGRTNAAEVIRQWSAGLDVPLLGVLRETQLYVRSLEKGLTIFDLPASVAATDLAQWQPILDWLQPLVNPPVAANDAPASRPPARIPGSRAQPLMPKQEALVPGARLNVLSAAKPLSPVKVAPREPSLARPATPGQTGQIPGFLRR